VREERADQLLLDGINVFFYALPPPEESICVLRRASVLRPMLGLYLPVFEISPGNAPSFLAPSEMK